MKERKQITRNIPLKNNINLSYHLSDIQNFNTYDPKGKKIQFIELFEVPSRFQNTTQFIPLSNRKSYRPSEKENYNKKLPDKKQSKINKNKARIKNGGTDHRKSKEIKNVLPIQKINHRRKRSNASIQRIGRSLDFCKVFNKNNKQFKSQTISPKRKSIEKQVRNFHELKKLKNLKTRPYSIKSSTPNNTVYTQGFNKVSNKTDHSHRLKQMSKLQIQNLKQIKDNVKEFDKRIKQNEEALQNNAAYRKLKQKKKSLQLQRRPVYTTTNRTIKNETKQENDDIYFELVSRIKTENRKIKNKSVNQQRFTVQQQTNNKGSSIFSKSSIIDESNLLENFYEIESAQLTEIDQINLNQLRNYEKKQLIDSEKLLANNNTNGNESKFLNNMAMKIQRCWRRYKTKNLINIYAGIFSTNREENLEQDEIFNHPSFQDLINSDQYQIKKSKLSVDEAINSEKSNQKQDSQLLYKKKSIQQQHIIKLPTEILPITSSKIKPSSQLIQLTESEKIHSQEVEQNVKSTIEKQKQLKCQELIKSIKEQELENWTQIVKLITNNLAGNQQNHTKQLLKKIIQQSQQNKKNLQKKEIKIQIGNEQKKSEDQNEFLKQQQQVHGLSVLQQKNPFSEFNSKKYREILNPKAMEQLFVSREKVLEEREKVQRNIIKQKRENNEISQITYNKKKKKLQNWFNNQTINLQKIKFQIQISLDRAKQAIKKTKLDYLIMQKMKGENSKNFLKINRSCSEQGLRHTIIDKKSKKRLEKSGQSLISQNSDLKQYDYYIQNHQLKVFNTEEDQNQDIHQLVEKYEQINNQYEEKSQQIISSQSEGQKLVKQQIKQPEHKSYFQEQQLSQSSMSLDAMQQMIIISKMCKDPKKLQQQCETQLLDIVILDFLKQLQNTEYLFINFKQKIKSTAKIVKTKKSLGIKTDSNAVQQFLQIISQYILNSHSNVLINLEKPTGPTAIEMLKYMHYYENQSDNNLDDESEPQNVLPLDVFQKFQKSNGLKFLPIININSEQEKAKGEYLKGLNRIFHRAIFDALNENLDHQRNFGNMGLPFPWKTNPVFYHKKFTAEIYKVCLQNAVKRTTNFASYNCGMIREQKLLNEPGEQQQILYIQNERMIKMMKQEFLQSEDSWTFYDDEETQVLIELSQLIIEILLNEGYKEIVHLLIR